METTSYNQAFNVSYSPAIARPSLLARFSNWCTQQEENRMLWIGLALGGHGCVITPITAMLTLAVGNSLVLFMVAMFAMALALVTNLAAMPTKITIPVFFLSILIDIAVIVAALTGTFDSL